MILVTGGAGYIGSHTVVELVNAGFDVLVLDNLCNSSKESLNRVEKITGQRIAFIQGDILDKNLLDQTFAQYDISGVIHFAGLKSVGESVVEPSKYYENNVVGTHTLVKAMTTANVKRLVFSSSATVYGDPIEVPINESAPTGGTTNPYGTSKYMIERMLHDICAADKSWRVSLLRYFNPVGAHNSGLIGEDPNGIPNNLLPYISQVAIGKLPSLKVFGCDYPTSDGTGVRDYIHVVDLAKGHLKALEFLTDAKGCFAHNLGTGKGYSVLEMVNAFAKVSGRAIPYDIVERRPGDIAVCYADTELAQSELNWVAELGLEDMMRDTWNWQSKNPNGYKSS
ncbi:UDP-glucose 4-epimerase GalE [Aliidiomarina haloalkalitolerans]|uniref:UDP-glucose 4-epimerase n=1 Tax=Aliidiomarina haloalkalitolerans TaxID=859059 RepID=A0A432VQW5_9GAMM|nr:UDP-glucose 4-epimerase GalE [Aliidiomarina haloalkalitolerans]RUO18664.1 UDP-glucose 4-epimerase GalE [Aliidiomarina haloalkalitolerans]